ncbi:hypothetical protein CDV31_014847 [Fusarium ambrosium]|uniref:Uncharacterized protein n=1 Tax=Fusarium ambrosium TaxID=131363 RepID=A0A428STM4_9HYPO|nr:hypothetical protein CDV31_014847 [Fusarium ambrosium]
MGLNETYDQVNGTERAGMLRKPACSDWSSIGQHVGRAVVFIAGFVPLPSEEIKTLYYPLSYAQDGAK